MILILIKFISFVPYPQLSHPWSKGNRVKIILVESFIYLYNILQQLNYLNFCTIATSCLSFCLWFGGLQSYDKKITQRSHQQNRSRGSNPKALQWYYFHNKVIKELVENAIDAEATQIRVTIINGGLTSIEVVDNGKGIKKADFPLLCERFATSKIS